MKHTLILLYLISFSVFAQDQISASLIQQDSLKADQFISKDNFGTVYYTNDNALIRQTETEQTSYSNVQLGNITSINTYNPLKINVFYADFNTLIILDNRLAEVLKTDFNTLSDYKNVSHVTTGFDSTVWLFNQDFQYLELFDYKTQTTRYKTIPVASKPLALTSNYNYCWLLTEDYLYCYNYFGSVIYKIKNEGYTNIKEANENIVLQKENMLLFYNHKTKTLQPIALSNMLISQFFVTNQILYIYTRKALYQYQLKTD